MFTAALAQSWVQHMKAAHIRNVDALMIRRITLNSPIIKARRSSWHDPIISGASLLKAEWGDWQNRRARG
jgi:hypothetical protein